MREASEGLGEGQGSTVKPLDGALTDSDALKVAKRVLIVGCGNVLLGDDGFGPAVAEKCLRLDHGRSIVPMDIGTQLSPLLIEMLYGDEKARGLVIVDIADGGRPPGTVFEVSLDDLERRSTDTFGLHDFPSPSVLKELRDNRGVEISILCCQPAPGPDTVRIGLSPEVAASVELAASTAIRRARWMLKALPSHQDGRV